MPPNATASARPCCSGRRQAGRDRKCHRTDRRRAQPHHQPRREKDSVTPGERAGDGRQAHHHQPSQQERAARKLPEQHLGQRRRNSEGERKHGEQIGNGSRGGAQVRRHRRHERDDGQRAHAQREISGGQRQQRSVGPAIEAHSFPWSRMEDDDARERQSISGLAARAATPAAAAHQSMEHLTACHPRAADPGWDRRPGLAVGPARAWNARQSAKSIAAARASTSMRSRPNLAIIGSVIACPETQAALRPRQEESNEVHRPASRPAPAALSAHGSGGHLQAPPPGGAGTRPRDQEHAGRARRAALRGSQPGRGPGRPAGRSDLPGRAACAHPPASLRWRAARHRQARRCLPGDGCSATPAHRTS